MPINLSRISFNTITMGGDLEHKLEVIRAAGFDSVELWAKDMLSHPGGAKAAAQAVRNSGLRVTGFQMLSDFDSAPKDVREQKIEFAKFLMQLMQLVDARLLRVCATTSPLSVDDRELAAENLSILATLAIPMGMKIGFEALPWSAWIKDYKDAWDVVRRANCPNLGMVVNACHMFARKSSLDMLRLIPIEKVFLVPLADIAINHGHSAELAQHHYLFPGEGAQQFDELLQLLEEKGYAGDFSFDVLNDDYVSAKPSDVAERAMKSAVWLSGGCANA